MLISEIYHAQPKTFAATATIQAALEELVRDRINALVIVDDHQSVLGVLSLQDIAAATVPGQFRKNIRMAAAMYKRGFFTEMCQQIKNEPVSSIMRRDFISVGLHDNIMAVTADFLKNDLYVVPVIQDKKLVGVVTRSEIKKALLHGMRQTGLESAEDS